MSFTLDRIKVHILISTGNPQLPARWTRVRSWLPSIEYEVMINKLLSTSVDSLSEANTGV